MTTQTYKTSLRKAALNAGTTGNWVITLTHETPTTQRWMTMKEKTNEDK
jgi:hypothetical protein